MRVSYPSSYPNPVIRSGRLKGKELIGRGGGIRTPDPLLPKQMRYQTALRPELHFDCTLNSYSELHRICGSAKSSIDVTIIKCMAAVVQRQNA